MTARTPPGQERLSADVLTLVLALALWVACGSLVTALAGEPGPHPLRRALVGVGLVIVASAALRHRYAVATALRARPWLVLAVVAATLGAAAVDGLLPAGPYVAVSLTPIGLAVIVARPRTVWLCVALLELGYVLGVVVERWPGALVRQGELSGALGAMLGPLFAALVGLGVVRLFARLMSDVEPRLEAMRRGPAGLSPALTQAIIGGAAARPQLSAGSVLGLLTAAERRVVDGLAAGRRPKELAHSWCVSVATVRTHIRNVKRKTGARTLSELVALAALAELTAREDA
jgi:DNA-binding CsgD family transcriptional regulator